MVQSRWQKQYYKKETGSRRLYVKPGCNLKVRFVGDPVKVVRAFTTDGTCITLDNEETGHRLKDKYPNKIGNISVRYACWCFDRHDDKMKILDMPHFVACEIRNRDTLAGKTVSGLEQGCDWKISTNGKKGMDVRYKVKYLEETSLTGTEKNIVEDRKLDNKRPYDLTKVFAGDSFVDANDKLSK